MKICWKNLEGVTLSDKGHFIMRRTKHRKCLEYKEFCAYCGEPYLMRKDSPTKYCSMSCVKMGKKLNSKTRYNMSKNSGVSKGGVSKSKLSLYDTYADRLSYVEDVSFYIDKEQRKLLLVKCSKCGNYYSPSVTAVHHRLNALNGKKEGESRFYCSQECKDNCEIFNKKSNYYLIINNTIEEFYTDYELSIWSKEVLYRANYKCEYCGKEAKHAHHIESKKLEPGLALDPVNGLACCVECHYKYGHKDEYTINKIKENEKRCQN